MIGPPSPSVALDRLTYRYPDGRLALDGVSFSLAPGEAVALVGPNGAGKSTLLLHLNGLLPDRRRAQAHGHAHGHAHAAEAGGVVRVEGIEVSEKTGPEVRRRVGLVFQDPDDQLFSTSVLEDVAFGPLNLGKARDEARRIALDCLARVGLAGFEDRAPHRLSVGERKRACLAGVLACEATVLVLDEPTAGLDPRGRRRFLDLLASLPATRLLATHDLEAALELCPRTLLLDAGRLVADGPTRDLLADAALMDRHGLEVPLSLKLARG